MLCVALVSAWSVFGELSECLRTEVISMLHCRVLGCRFALPLSVEVQESRCSNEAGVQLRVCGWSDLILLTH